MDITKLVEDIPYIYHLTDRRNLDYILESNRIFSTTKLYHLAKYPADCLDLRIRRPDHLKLMVDEKEIFIRDQRPLNAALDKCLTPGWTREMFIFHLNSRVFFWPNLNRLNIHFSRYQNEKPIILRVKLEEAIEYNPNPLLCRLNSGATRPLGSLGGKAPLRGEGTFLSVQNFNLNTRDIAEVTFEHEFIIPENIKISNSPGGKWKVL